MTSKSAAPPKPIEPEDDEIAPPGFRVNPFVDHGLGLLLLCLIARYGVHIYEIRDAQPSLAIWVASSFLFTVVLIAVVGRLAHGVGQAISRHRTGGTIPADCAAPLKSAVAQKKWKDQAWQLVIHASMSVWEVRLLSQNPQWWADPSTCFKPCPADAGQFSDELQLFYVLQLSLWIWTGVSCKWLEERRKDYVEMMMHHVLTVWLILNSFVGNELPIGLVVLACHDISDIALDLMKMANYLKVEGAHGFFITELCFLVNTCVTWPYFRLYVFPAFVIHGVAIGYHKNCATNFPGEPLKNPFMPEQPGSYWESTLMLSALFVLHCFWFFLLIKIAYKLITGDKANKIADEEYEITMKDQKTGGKKEK